MLSSQKTLTNLAKHNPVLAVATADDLASLETQRVGISHFFRDYRDIL